MHRPPIPKGYVLSVNHALQGHPEAPRLCEKHIHGILVNELKFTPTTHEKWLYSRRHPEHPTDLQMILRHIDDFSVSASDTITCKEIKTKTNYRVSTVFRRAGPKYVPRTSGHAASAITVYCTT